MADYGPRVLRSVSMKGFQARYGFLTSLPEAEAVVLGQITALSNNGTLLPGVVVGANSPKPPKANRVRATGETDTSFVNYADIAAARAAGWTIRAGKIRIPRTTLRARPVYVESLAGPEDATIRIRYGWNMPLTQYNEVGADRAALGIVDIDETNYGEVLFGINNPKPKRAVRRRAAGGVVTTFVGSAAENALPANWSLVGGGSSRFGL